MSTLDITTSMLLIITTLISTCMAARSTRTAHTPISPSMMGTLASTPTLPTLLKAIKPSKLFRTGRADDRSLRSCHDSSCTRWFLSPS
ncbi:hypothetical protein MRX96_016366 [Rhipicephalus microplus]